MGYRVMRVQQIEIVAVDDGSSWEVAVTLTLTESSGTASLDLTVSMTTLFWPLSRL